VERKINRNERKKINRREKELKLELFN